MMESKFKRGDRVRIVRYGSPHYIAKADYSESSKFYARLGHEMESMLMWGVKPSKEELDKIVGQDVPNHIISEDEKGWWCDLHPKIVGQEGIVAGSYADLYGASKDEDYRSYSIDGIPEKCAWYNEEQLEAVN